MMLCQDEILSLLFMSTSIKSDVSMKQIQEFLDSYSENCTTCDNDEKNRFFMPMHDDFNQEIFKEDTNTGNFYVINPNSKKTRSEILKNIRNVIKEDNDFSMIKTMNKFKEDYNNKKMVESKKNNENSIKKIKKLIFRKK